MPNRDGPRGFIPRFHLFGSTIKVEHVTLAAANAAVGVGDPLVEGTDGRMDRAAAGDPIGGIAAAAAAASSAATIPVYRDPGIVFSAQTDDGTGVATAETAINLNINFIAGAPSGGRSISELDESSATTTATLPFKIRGRWLSPDNAFGEFNELLVTVNNHKDKGGTGTVGL